MDRNSVILEGCHDCVLKISAIKEIRQAADCGLTGAKRALEECLSGNKPRISVVAGVDALDFADKLAKLGMVVRIGDRVFDRHKHRDFAHTYRDDEIGTIKLAEMLPSQDGHSFTVVGELLGGSVATGNQLGIPLNSTLVVTSQIVTVDVFDKLVKLELASEDESFAFWEAMDLVDEELPVLETKEEDG